MRKIPLISITFCLLLPLCARATVAEDRQAVLNYISGLPNKPNKRVISGEYFGRQAAPANGVPYQMSGIEEIHDMTGKWIGMVGGDYYQFLNNQTCEYDNKTLNPTGKSVNDYLIEYWQAGGLITLVTQICNPDRYDPVKDATTQCGHLWKAYGYPDPVTGLIPETDFNAILTPGTFDYGIFTRELDRIAAGLQQLENAGAIVLYRAYPEANGGFWWAGMQSTGPGAEGYKRIWRFTHDYFTNVKDLDNIIWVYAPGATTWGVKEFYPGGAYVDMVAFDSYPNNTNVLNHAGTQYAYDTLTAEYPGKPIGFGEHAEHSSRASLTQNYDYSDLIEAIETRYPRSTFFQAWWTEFSIEQQDALGEATATAYANALFNHPWTINRGDICIPGVADHEQGCFASADDSCLSVSGQLLSNCGFDSGTSAWTHFNNGAGTFDVPTTGGYSGDEYGRVTVTTVTSPANIQLYRTPVTVTEGQTYTLQFQARSSTTHDVKVSLQKHTTPYTDYGINMTLLNLTAGWESQEIVFAVPETADPNHTGASLTDGRLMLYLSDNAQSGDIYSFDSFQLVPGGTIDTAPGAPSGLAVRW